MSISIYRYEANIKRLPDGTVLVVEEARKGRKTLALTSLRKYPVAKDYDSITQTLLSNALSDNGKFRIAHQNSQDQLASNPEVQVEKAKEALDKAGVTGTDRTSTIAAVRRGDLTAQEVAESHKPSAKIEDFGEKIGGAKKDLRQTYQKAMSEELPVDAKNITLSSKTGPSPFRMQNTVPLVPCH